MLDHLITWFLARPRVWESGYALGYMALLLLVSAVPATGAADQRLFGLSMEWAPPPVQNLLHLPAYAVLALLWCRTLTAWPLRLWTVVTAAVTASVIYGIATELFQMSVPGRYSSLADCVLNTLGACVGGWIYARARSRLALG